jgi:hypothetical protein
MVNSDVGEVRPVLYEVNQSRYLKEFAEQEGIYYLTKIILACLN